MAKEAGINERQRRFADFYIETLDIAESYKKAGYSWKEQKDAYDNGYALLKRENVKAYVDDLLSKKQQSRILRQDEILEGYTQIYRGKNTATKDKLKALDSLAKINGMFVEKVQHETKIEIKLPDFIKQNMLQNKEEPKYIEPVEYEVGEDNDEE